MVLPLVQPKSSILDGAFLITAERAEHWACIKTSRLPGVYMIYFFMSGFIKVAPGSQKLAVQSMFSHRLCLSSL